MEYIETIIEIDESGVEPALAKLSMIGIDDAEVRDPRDAEEIMADKETYEWDYVDEKVAEGLGKRPEIAIYHEAGTEDENSAFEEQITRAMAELASDAANGVYGDVSFGEIEVSSSLKDDSLWKDKWKEYFKPVHITDRMVVRPSWEEYEEKPGEIVITIDPGMAFGTGTHETTSMCMKALEKYLTPGMKVLDAGCGSGILSIAAAKLGASDVLGVDIDNEAVRVSEENFTLNGTSGVAHAEYGDVTKGVGFTADLVCANLMAELLCMISKGAYDHLEEGGIFISSGILREKEEMVREAFDAAGFVVKEVMYDGEWCCVICEK